jgi:hypothetical protein
LNPLIVSVFGNLLATNSTAGASSPIDTVASILNSNLVGLVVSGVLGVSLATYIARHQRLSQRKEQLRKTAILLGGEIYSTQRLCEKFLKDTQLAEEARGALARGTTMVVTLGDPDFPRTIYDKPSTDVGLFSDLLAATIAELYRFLDFARDAKMKANGFSAELSETIQRLENPASTQRVSDNSKRAFAAAGFDMDSDRAVWIAFLYGTSQLVRDSVGFIYGHLGIDKHVKLNKTEGS